MPIKQQLKLSEFDYSLPSELIAFYPFANRENSKLLVVEEDEFLNAKFCDQYFTDLIDHINPNDLIIFNNSKVLKARLIGQKITGGKIEILIERIIDNQHILAHVRSNKPIKNNLKILLNNQLEATVINRIDQLFILTFNEPINLLEYLEIYGQIPLPPYISRPSDNDDSERYQTVYAKYHGSVAAPTAGLHFSTALINKIKAKGASVGFVTLHIGSGTFKPVNCENISEHKMHSEIYHVTSETLNLIKQTKTENGKIFAVGTTSLRTLETIAQNDFSKLSGETDIFITPGYKFKVVDKLITNFHLPKSTLLMLVSAFAGIREIKEAYQYAIKNRYRFFSYGDAMLLTRKDS